MLLYTVCINCTLNGSFALQCFNGSNAIKIRSGIMFDFYPGLPHIHVCGSISLCLEDPNINSVTMSRAHKNRRLE